MTVKELKKAIRGVPDDTPVWLSIPGSGGDDHTNCPVSRLSCVEVNTKEVRIPCVELCGYD